MVAVESTWYRQAGGYITLTEQENFDCAVIGAGPIGMAAASAFATSGFSTAIVGALPAHDDARPDLRTAALFDGSVRFLDKLGVWHALEPDAHPIKGIRIIDAGPTLFRAPETIFGPSADEKRMRNGVKPDSHFGYNVPNTALVNTFKRHLMDGSPGLRCAAFDVKVTEIVPGPDAVTIKLADGRTWRTRALIAADGRGSISRAAAKIEYRSWNGNQSALTTQFSHTLPHNNVSTEFQRRNGPCTVVPMAANQSSLVWIDETSRCQERQSLPAPEFVQQLEHQLNGLLGPITEMKPRRTFPLITMIADRFAQKRTFLVGESAHVFPPIGAQGLNLGLRDVANLIDVLVDARKEGADIGSATVCERYHRARNGDISARTYGVDLLNRSLANAPASYARGALFHTMIAIPTLKRFVVERGLRPPGPWPTMMQ